MVILEKFFQLDKKIFNKIKIEKRIGTTLQKCHEIA